MEARAGIEPAIKGFADLPLTGWVPRHLEDCWFEIEAAGRFFWVQIRSKAMWKTTKFEELSHLR